MSPSMFARVDDVRFQNGFGPARNYEVLPNGSLTRRPGLRHVRRCKFNNKRCRLIPFTFSIEQTMQVELGELYFRFHLGQTQDTRMSGGEAVAEGMIDLAHRHLEQSRI